VRQPISLVGDLVESGPGGAWFIVRPFAVADTPLDPAVTVGCILLLCVIFVIEVLTPGAVVAAFALLPLVVGMWLLSDRFAAVVLAATTLLFVAAALIEAGNRLTVVLVAIPILAGGVLARLYAAHLPHAPVVLAGAPHDRLTVAALTRRELEVARLAASAYTAAEIGQQLHIGERTVESHLASTYLKLGITSRSELIRMAEKLS
jgi:DNA-binding CsgD family transcriptional regulator